MAQPGRWQPEIRPEKRGDLHPARATPRLKAPTRSPYAGRPPRQTALEQRRLSGGGSWETGGSLSDKRMGSRWTWREPGWLEYAAVVAAVLSAKVNHRVFSRRGRPGP